jgi:hypothetical protein
MKMDKNNTRITKILAAILAAAVMLTMLPLTAVLAATDVSYIDEAGTQQIQASTTNVTADMTTWGAADETTWYSVSDDVTIATRVTVSGDVRLILTDGYELTASEGIGVNATSSLTIYAQSTDADTMGALTATGRNYRAGIGNGHITINGGTITANGGFQCAGIGSELDGVSGAVTTVTINGGTITANGGGLGAGIGNCWGGSGGPVTIIINGGTITATGGSDFRGGIGAGIGGSHNGSGGNITINGGTVTAIGGSDGRSGSSAGIGGGDQGSGGTIIITGGVVTATGGPGAVGIGDGQGGASGTFELDGNAVVYASSIDSAHSVLENGILFEGDVGTVYGDVTIPGDVEAPEGATLTIPAGTTLTVPVGAALTVELGAVLVNNGTIINNGEIVNDGTFTNNGAIVNDGTFTNNGDLSSGATGEISGDGSFGGTATSTVILPSWVTISTPTYTGSPQTPTATVNNGSVLMENTHFTLSGNSATDAGDHTLTVTGIDPYSGSVKKTWAIAKAAPPPVVFPAPDAVTYHPEQTLSAIALTGSGDGSFAWDDGTTVPTVSNYGYSVTFTPNDADNYDYTDIALTRTVALTVDPAQLTVEEAPSAGSVYLNQELLYSALTGGVVKFGGTEITGAFSWADSTEKVTAKGDYDAIFTPDESYGGNYAPVDLQVSVSIRSVILPPDNPPAKTTPAADGTVSVSYTQTGGAVTVALPDGTVNEIISKSDGAAVIDLSKATNATSAALPTSALDKLADAGLDVELKLPQGTIILNTDAAASISEQAGGASVSVGLKTVAAAALNAAQREAIGDAVVYDISVTGGGKQITGFGGGSVTMTLPYTLKEGEVPEGVVALYVDAGGNTEKLPTTYDAAAKQATFKTTHLSLYAVGYDEALSVTPWVNPFFDISSSDWFYGDVEYAYVNGLMTGISSTEFAPNIKLSRAMLVTVLYRYASASSVPSSSAPAFTDVPANAWYRDAIAWASANGIVTGAGDNKFAPDEYVTREQFATILYRFAQLSVGYGASTSSGKPAGNPFLDVPPPSGNTDISDFTDAGDVASWAVDAMKWAVSAGLINGIGGGKIAPLDEATRAEAAALLRRYIENVG